MPAESTAARYARLRDVFGADHPATIAAFNERLAELLEREERDPAPGLYFLSFATEAEFLGATIVEANGITSALLRSKALGANPGGSVETSGPFPPAWISILWRNRLLTAEEIEKIPPPPDDFVEVEP